MSKKNKIAFEIFFVLLITISGFLIYEEFLVQGIKTTKFWGIFSLWINITFFISGIFFTRKRARYIWDYNEMIVVKIWNIIGLSGIVGIITWIILGEFSNGFDGIFLRLRFIIGTSVIFMIVGMLSSVIKHNKTLLKARHESKTKSEPKIKTQSKTLMRFS